MYIKNMVSEAQKKAYTKYRQSNRKRIQLEFYPPEYELYEWLHKKGGTEIKQILKKVMKDEQE